MHPPDPDVRNDKLRSFLDTQSFYKYLPSLTNNGICLLFERKKRTLNNRNCCTHGNISLSPRLV
jgi:hypothetical protein